MGGRGGEERKGKGWMRDRGRRGGQPGEQPGEHVTQVTGSDWFHHIRTYKLPIPH